MLFISVDRGSESKVYRLKKENWKMEVGTWKLEIGDWKLEAGNRKPETGNQRGTLKIQRAQRGKLKIGWKYADGWRLGGWRLGG